MARSRKACPSARRASADEGGRKFILRFTKEQVDVFKRPRPQIKREISSPPPSLPSLSSPPETRTDRNPPKTTLRPVRCVILKMWNGSRVAIHSAEVLVIQCGAKIYKYTIKAARCVQLS